MDDLFQQSICSERYMMLFLLYWYNYRLLSITLPTSPTRYVLSVSILLPRPAWTYSIDIPERLRLGINYLFPAFSTHVMPQWPLCSADAELSLDSTFICSSSCSISSLSFRLTFRSKESVRDHHRVCITSIKVACIREPLCRRYSKWSGSIILFSIHSFLSWSISTL
jgi:hypothetical protein